MTAGGPWDLGDTVRLTAAAVDAGGAAVNCTAMVLTVTQPDGTTVTPAVTNPPAATGAYTVDFVPTQVGRHKVRWVGTTPAFAYTDIFDVLPADPQFIISLADAREALRKTPAATADDSELRLYVAALTTIVEGICGPQSVTTRTVTRSGGKSALLLPSSVVAIVSVTENGGALTANSDYTVDADAGIVYRGNSVQPFPFLPGHDNVTITYTAGQSIAASNVRLAARIIVKHLWQADNTGSSGRPGIGATVASAGADVVAVPGGYAIPRRAVELLAPTPNLIPGFA